MKTNAIVRIVIFSVIIVILLGILALGLGIGAFVNNVDSYLSSDAITDGNRGGGSVAADEVRGLNVQWVSGSVTIQPADTDKIVFSENALLSEHEKMVWKQSGDTLVIQFCPTQIFGVQVDRSKDLVVVVPQDWFCDELDIESVSAEVEVDGLTADEISLENVSGKCTFTNCTADEMNVETVSGNVEFSGSLLYGMECSSVSGNLRIAPGGGAQTVSMDSISGDLVLFWPKDHGFTADIDSISGGISSEFSTTTEGGRHIHGDGACRVRIDSVSGDIIIQKAD